jgi:hypothetical protein
MIPIRDENDSRREVHQSADFGDVAELVALIDEQERARRKVEGKYCQAELAAMETVEVEADVAGADVFPFDPAVSPAASSAGPAAAVPGFPGHCVTPCSLPELYCHLPGWLNSASVIDSPAMKSNA